MMVKDYVSDEEELYRNVRKELDNEEYYFDENTGKLEIRGKAFLDPDKQPSVDRAKLRNFDPKESRIGKGDGIVSLFAKDVRQIGDVKGDGNIIHAVDIKPDRTEDNEAHALITVQPEFFGSNNKQNKTFKLLRIALARLATENGWTLEPEIS